MLIADMVKDADIVRNYDENGVFSIELLPGICDIPTQAFKYYLTAGASVSPKAYTDKAVVCVFGKGKGFIAGDDGGFVIDEISFYAPNYDKSNYTIHATTDLEFIYFTCDMDEYDFEREQECSVYLPFFRKVSQCYRYEQYCKAVGTISRSVMFGDCGRLGKITIGYNRGFDTGTVEKGHGEVHQFNYAIGDDCDFTMTVEGMSKRLFRHNEGDFSFVYAGQDHSLVASPGKHVGYIWIEIYTSKHGVY